MKKILFVCYDGYRTTNARVRCYRFSKELKKQGIDAEVFSFKDHLNATYDGFESYKVGLLEKFSLLVRATKRLWQERKDTVFYIQKAGFFALAPYFVHLFKGNKFVLDYDDYEYEASMISKFLLRLLARKAVLCITASHYLQNFLRRYNKRVYYIPTGVGLEVFKKKRKRKGREIVFTWIGIIVNKEALQNVLFIVDSFKEIVDKHNNVKLEIVGGGKYIKDVEKVIREIGSNQIKYIGKLQPDKVPDYLSKVDVGLFVLLKDSKYNRSKSPTKLFEYMATGLAIISTGVGESGFVIKDGETGLLASSEQDFIEKVESLVKNPRLISRLGTAAREAVEQKYNLATLGKELSDLLNSSFG